jgi:hypothetical protein
MGLGNLSATDAIYNKTKDRVMEFHDFYKNYSYKPQKKILFNKF